MTEKIKAACYRIANLIYHKVFTRFPALRRASVREALSRVGIGAEASEEAYYTKKIAQTAAILLLGGLMVAFSHWSARRNAALTDDGALRRNAQGGRDTTASLIAQTEDGTDIGAYEVAIEAKRYTYEEASALAEEAREKLPEAIVGENPSLAQASQPLRLVGAVAGYPFTISWSTENYARLQTDGTVVAEDAPKDGETVRLTATLRYQEWTWDAPIYVTVVPPVLSDEETAQKAVANALQKAQEETLYEDALVLPTDVSGKRIAWKEVVRDDSPVLLALVVVAAIGAYFAQDGALQTKLKRREEQLSLSYAGFVSQLALYLGAGMTVRGVFLKAAADYDKRRKQGAPTSYLYEEIRVAASELTNGVSESAVYERFAQRARLQEYTKLCALLTQNLKKGSSQMLATLKTEATTATRLRMDAARVKGEQAGTKLMAPMMLMLMVVMTLVMAPAYMSF